MPILFLQKIQKQTASKKSCSKHFRTFFQVKSWQNICKSNANAGPYRQEPKWKGLRRVADWQKGHEKGCTTFIR